MAEISQYFKPEFINRIDETVVFHPLLSKQIQQIAQIQLQALAGRLTEKSYSLKISDEAIELISAVGFDPVFGARPLKRAIQQQIENPLAHKILSGEFTEGDHIVIDIDDGALRFSNH